MEEMKKTSNVEAAKEDIEKLKTKLMRQIDRFDRFIFIGFNDEEVCHMGAASQNDYFRFTMEVATDEYLLKMWWGFVHALSDKTFRASAVALEELNKLRDGLQNEDN